MVATQPAQSDVTASQNGSRRRGRIAMRTKTGGGASQFTASPPDQHNDKGASLMNHHRTRRKTRLPSIPPLTIALVLATTARSTLADYPPARETPIGAPGRSIAANDQSSAISTNPANLGFLPSSEVRWTWVRTSEESRVPARGHAFDFAFVLPWRIGTGLRLDFARPGGLWPNYTWLT